MLSIQNLVRLAFSAALLLASTARAEESTVSRTKVTPEMGGDRQLELTAWRGEDRLAVDGEDSAKIGFRSFGAQIHYAPKVVTLDLSGTDLQRKIRDLSRSGDADKATTIVTPSIGLHLTPRLVAKLSFSDIRTHVENSLVDRNYELDANRKAASLEWRDGVQTLVTTLASEVRAEASENQADRDYVPAQIEVLYGRQVSGPLAVGGKLRYSQYNDDVYKDDYDTDVPKSPTVRQVLDYLLSFSAGASYDIAHRFQVLGGAERKAALDTNSYTGEDYLVSTAATIGAKTRFSDAATVSASATTAQGSKTHDVDGQSYDYASRTTRFEASVALAM